MFQLRLTYRGKIPAILLVLALTQTACVSQNRYRNEVAARSMLESQLQQKRHQNGKLRREREQLGQRLINRSKRALSTQQEQLTLIEAQNNQIKILESEAYRSKAGQDNRTTSLSTILTDAEDLAQNHETSAGTANKIP